MYKTIRTVTCLLEFYCENDNTGGLMYAIKINTKVAYQLTLSVTITKYLL